MILVNTMQGEKMYINPDMIETIRATPDTVLFLNTNKRIIVKDTLNEVVFTNTRGTVPLYLQKLDQDGKPLSGAVFRLQNADGDTINVVKNRDGIYAAITSAASLQPLKIPRPCSEAVAASRSGQ